MYVFLWEIKKETRNRAVAEMNAEKTKDETSSKRIESLMKSLEIW